MVYSWLDQAGAFLVLKKKDFRKKYNKEVSQFVSVYRIKEKEGKKLFEFMGLYSSVCKQDHVVTVFSSTLICTCGCFVLVDSSQKSETG